MIVLTPAERRAVLLVVGLLVLGTLADVWETRRPRPSLGEAPRSDRPAAADRHAEGGAVRALAADSITASPVDSMAEAPRIDLNRATVEQLDALPGVGPVLSRRILDYRRMHGPFRDPRDLRAVRGIGPRLYAKLRPFVRTDSATAPR